MNDEIVNKITNAVEIFRVGGINQINMAQENDDDDLEFPPLPRLMRQINESRIVDGIHLMLQRNVNCIFIESSYGMDSLTYVFRDINDRYYQVTYNLVPESFDISLIQAACIEEGQARFAEAPVELVRMVDDVWDD